MRLTKITLFLLIVIGISFPTSAQITLKVEQIPTNTPAQDDLFVAGSFNGWDPGLDTLTQDSAGSYWFTIPAGTGTIEYKFTRGSWTTPEGSENGGYRPNRSYTFGNGDTLALEILSWEDVGGTNSTAAANVQILDNSFFIPQLNRNRKIWLYLPPDYDSSQKAYPVLYMHDGQNLFDDATSFSGEWKVDETLNQLHQDGDYGVIVVGIENGGNTRLDEYSPWFNPTYGGGEGDLYLQFITQTLKPHIDSSFRTLPEREFTGIMGSSMGGLISHYGGIAYAEYFSKAGVFSPSFFFSDSAFQVTVDQGNQFDGKFYFMAGAMESGSMVPRMQAMYDTMQNIGYTSGELSYLVESDGQHSEWFWAREFGDAYQWLFGDLVLNIEQVIDSPIQIFPNPFHDSITISVAEKRELFLYDIQGNLIRKFSINGSETVNVDHLPKGVYLLKMEHAGQSQVKRLLKVE